jgi:lysozyme family protein
MKFDQSFMALIGHEGGFTDDPKDRGNWTSGVIGKGELKGTKYGVSAMSYPQVDIRNLTLDNAKAIYKRDFWDKAKCDTLPDAIRFDVFDMAVNSGVKRAIETLQSALGVKADGIIGNQTMEAIKALDPQLLDKRLSGHRLLFIANVGTFPTYGRGWVRRVANNLLQD